MPYTQEEIDAMNAVAAATRGWTDNGDGTYTFPGTGAQGYLAGTGAPGDPVHMINMGKASSSSGPQPPGIQSKTINGHVYNFNPQTGAYEDTGLTDGATSAPYQHVTINGKAYAFNPQTGQYIPQGGQYYGFDTPEQAQAFAAQHYTPEQIAAMQQVASSGQDPLALVQNQQQLALQYAQLNSQEKQQAASLAYQYMNAGLDANSARMQAMATLIANKTNASVSLANTGAQIGQTIAQLDANPRDAVSDIMYRNMAPGSTPYGSTSNAAFGQYQTSLDTATQKTIDMLRNQFGAAADYINQPLPAEYTKPIATPNPPTIAPTVAPQLGGTTTPPAGAPPAAPAGVAGMTAEQARAFAAYDAQVKADQDAANLRALAASGLDTPAKIQAALKASQGGTTTTTTKPAATSSTDWQTQMAKTGHFARGGTLSFTPLTNPGRRTRRRPNQPWLPDQPPPGQLQPLPTNAGPAPYPVTKAPDSGGIGPIGALPINATKSPYPVGTVPDAILNASSSGPTGTRNSTVTLPQGGTIPAPTGPNRIANPWDVSGIPNGNLDAPGSNYGVPGLSASGAPTPVATGPGGPDMSNIPLNTGTAGGYTDAYGNHYDSQRAAQIIQGLANDPDRSNALARAAQSTAAWNTFAGPQHTPLHAAQLGLPIAMGHDPITNPGYSINPASVMPGGQYYTYRNPYDTTAEQNANAMYDPLYGAPMAAGGVGLRHFAHGGTVTDNMMSGMMGGGPKAPQLKFGYAPPSSEGGTNMNIHEPSKIVGIHSGHVYATMSENAPEQLIIKPLKSVQKAQMAAEQRAKKNSDGSQQFATGGTIDYISGIRQQLRQIDPQAVAQPGQDLPDPRLLAAGVYNRMQLDPDLAAYIKAAYSKYGISDNTLDSTLKQYRPGAFNTGTVSYR